jgi:hypothetical protein
MKPRTSVFWSLFVAATTIALVPTSAHAQYLDPGAGSIILQAVIAVAVGAATAVKVYWNRISAFLSRRRNGV